jgi:hypothetical protein
MKLPEIHHNHPDHSHEDELGYHNLHLCETSPIMREL